MKYGIIVNGRVTEPVAIPAQLPNWAATPIALLEKLFPGKTGWVVVPDDAVPGTIDNGDGTFTTVTPPAPVKEKTPEEFEAWAIRRLGSVQAWQNLLEKCADHVGTTDNDREVRYFTRWTQLQKPKSKDEFATRCTPLTLVTPTPIISASALQNALNAW